MTSLRRRARQGFTLIELMIGLAVMAVLVVLVGPSFLNMIDMQRLRGTSAQFVTDVQFARSEAISRQQSVVVSLGSNDAMTCYVVYSCPVSDAFPPSNCDCDCTRGEGDRCRRAELKELRAVQIPRSSMIELTPTANPDEETISFVLFDPMTGGMQPWNVGLGTSLFVSTGSPWSKVSLVRNQTKTLRTMISQGGRPSVCTPANQLVSGATTCEP